MITAVDSSVLLDLITDDRRHAAASQEALREGRRMGRLVICDCVLAEIRPALASDDQLQEFLRDLTIEYSATTQQSARTAGGQFAAYLFRGGRSGRVVPDFLIAAHASHQADRLLARDRGFLRDYFAGLVVLDPSRPSS